MRGTWGLNHLMTGGLVATTLFSAWQIYIEAGPLLDSRRLDGFIAVGSIVLALSNLLVWEAAVRRKVPPGQDRIVRGARLVSLPCAVFGMLALLLTGISWPYLWNGALALGSLVWFAFAERSGREDYPR